MEAKRPMGVNDWVEQVPVTSISNVCKVSQLCHTRLGSNQGGKLRKKNYHLPWLAKPNVNHPQVSSNQEETSTSKILGAKHSFTVHLFLLYAVYIKCTSIMNDHVLQNWSNLSYIPVAFFYLHCTTYLLPDKTVVIFNFQSQSSSKKPASFISE